MGKRADLSDSARQEIMHFLLGSCSDGRPTHGKINEAAATYNVCRKTVTRIWKSADEQRSGRGKPSKRVVNEAEIEGIHFQKRGTIRALAESIKVPRTTVGKWAKAKLVRAHTNAIKPDLIAPNKLLRLSFCLQAITYDSETASLKFKHMENIIHIDEKWFYLTKKAHRFYMTPLEEEPHRTCKSQKFIAEVMFMCVVCQPIFDSNGQVILDGKIGMWPFTQEVEAKRNIKKKPLVLWRLSP